MTHHLIDLITVARADVTACRERLAACKAREQEHARACLLLARAVLSRANKAACKAGLRPAPWKPKRKTPAPCETGAMVGDGAA